MFGSKFWLGLFGLVTVLHLLVFIKYPFSDPANLSFFTEYGEQAKTYLPILLLATLVPRVYGFTDKFVKEKAVNIAGLMFLALCLIYQTAGVSGQAWSTLAFSSSLILLLYNFIISHHQISQTQAIIFSFMVAWLGWIVFEIVFQIGLWFYYPMAFAENWNIFMFVMMKLVLWGTPAIVYMVYMLKDKFIKPRIEIRNKGVFATLMLVASIAVVVWYLNGMLIPIPVTEEGVSYLLPIDHFTREHLEFSISRLSQISIMSAFVFLFWGYK